MLSSVILLNEQIDFCRIMSECYYKDIAYVVASSGKKTFSSEYQNDIVRFRMLFLLGILKNCVSSDSRFKRLFVVFLDEIN